VTFAIFGQIRKKKKPSVSKENIQHFKKLNFSIFSTFVGYSFCPPGSGYGSTDLIGSETLVKNADRAFAVFLVS
jgi:hypothetical protein